MHDGECSPRGSSELLASRSDEPVGDFRPHSIGQLDGSWWILISLSLSIRQFPTLMALGGLESYAMAIKPYILQKLFTAIKTILFSKAIHGH